MGDEIELKILPKQVKRFFKITSNAVTFQIKGYIVISLLNKPRFHSNTQIFMIKFHNNNHLLTIENYRNGPYRSLDIPNLISTTEYRSFWLQWENNCVQLGKFGEEKPLLSIEGPTNELKYLSFYLTPHSMYPAYVKLDLPPILDRSVNLHKKLTGGEPIWVPTESTNLPPDAVVGGFENSPLYVIRAPIRGSLTPGKLKGGTGYIAWGGNANEVTTFEVLCGYNYQWQQCHSMERIPSGAVIGGYSEDSEEPLYVGRAMHDGYLIPGKVQPSHKVCYVPYDGKEIANGKFEILVTSENVQCRGGYDEFFMDSDEQSSDDED